MARKRKIVIVGGGCAGVAAAWELSRPGSDVAVTLYQEGWRLGGKGASGRGVSGRIEEHGLHLWLGYYENAFRLVREAHAHLAARGIDCPPFSEGFEPLPRIGVFAEQAPDAWIGIFPDEPGEPGDGAPIDSLRDSATTGPRIVRLLVHLLESITPSGEETLAAETARVIDLLNFDPGGIPQVALTDTQLLTRLVALRETVRPVLEAVAMLGDRARSLSEVVDVVLATTIGFLQERLDPGWYARLNQFDFREWLETQDLVLSSSTENPLLASLYNLAFAYEAGDRSRPRIAAGVALECAIRTFLTYKHAPFWRMKAGMGDAVFAPIYLALRDRGAEIRFFHRLHTVEFEYLPTRDPRGQIVAPGSVRSLQFAEQARTRDDARYEPLVDIKGFPCWPAGPLVDQLDLAPGAHPGRFEDPADGSSVGHLTLRAGEHFDHVVLALGSESALPVMGEIVSRDSRWREMAAASHTVATQSLQLWLKPTVAELGWRHGPAAMTGLATGLDTWADMSHLAAREDWPEQPGALIYLCGAVAERDAASVAEQADEDAERLLTVELLRALPGAFDAGGFRADLLAGGATDGQYRVLNARGSARYSQSLPGSIAGRLSPLDDSLSNLSLAGDWTDCGLNVGCVEAAVSSGIMAAGAATARLEIARLVGHNFVRPWFPSAPVRLTPPPPTSELDARLLAHSSELQAAVDAELDSFDSPLFDAAIWAAEPSRARIWATDSLPIRQAFCVAGVKTTLLSGISIEAPGRAAVAFSVEWVSQGGAGGTARLHVDASGALLIDVAPPPVAVGQRAVHHVLLCGPNGQAALLFELRVIGE